MTGHGIMLTNLIVVAIRIITGVVVIVILVSHSLVLFIAFLFFTLLLLLLLVVIVERWAVMATCCCYCGSHFLFTIIVNTKRVIGRLIIGVMDKCSLSELGCCCCSW